MLIESRPPLDPALASLVVAEHRETGDRVFEPDGSVAYLVGFVAGRAAACGGWQAAGSGAAEFRRLFVRPAYRGRGLARQMIVAIEEEALAAGRPTIRLEVGAGLVAAIALFQSSGYHLVAASGDRRSLAKQLPALVQ